ncbi:MAG: hypothetical protein AABO57_11240 [Acidobacteriota bacterium]
MKPSIIRPYAALLVLIALLSGCSSSTGPSGSSNTNAPQQQANSNAAEQLRVAQNNASPSTPPTVQSIPPPEPKAAGNAVTPAEKPPADRSANTASSARAPKLIAPEKKIDFGKHPQDKTLIRAIAIRNGGRADLNIEAVVPS